MLAKLTTPGTRTSEFLVTLLAIVADVCLAWAGTIGDGTAAKYGIAGSIGYVLSRGLAKYETRTTTPTPTPPPQPPQA